MVTFSRLKTTDDILSVNDCYALVISPAESDDAETIRKVAVVQMHDGKPDRQILVRMQSSGSLADGEESVYPEEDIAQSLSSLLLGSTVLAEADSLRALHTLFERFLNEGELDFLPVSKLSDMLFPETEGMSLAEKAEALSISVPDEEEEIREAIILGKLLSVCQKKINGDETTKTSPSKKKEEKKSIKSKLKLPPITSPSKKTISNKTLKRMADSVWRISPWVFAAIAAVIVLFVVFLVPRGEHAEIDRTVAPNSYLVLSWNDPGTYGSKQKGSDSIHFNVPYGVYNVLNNNSIPVELNIYGGVEPQTLAAGEESQSQKVTIRPNSSREITVDTDQYVTLSEDAVDLIFFYVSAVPEEVEETTTGQIAEHQVIVYGYVKGTDVRFRNAPSLEGNIIQTLNNGQQVQILGVTGEWTYVSIQDQKGYIFSDYVSTEPVE